MIAHEKFFIYEFRKKASEILTLVEKVRQFVSFVTVNSGENSSC